MSVSGYPKQGNLILGKVISFQSKKLVLDKEGLPYATLGYQNGRGFHDFSRASKADYVYEFHANAGRYNLTNIDTEGREVSPRSTNSITRRNSFGRGCSPLCPRTGKAFDVKNYSTKSYLSHYGLC